MRYTLQPLRLTRSQRITGYFVVALASIMTLLQLATLCWPQAQLLSQLEFIVGQPLSQQPWRIITAHFIHLDWQHLVVNVVAFVAAWWIFAANYTSLRMACLLTLSALGAAVLSHFFAPAHSFVGFSALTHGMVGYATMQVLRGNSDIRVSIGAVMLLAIVIKTVVELNAQQINWLGVEAAAHAHLGAMLAGLIFGVLTPMLTRNVNSNKKAP